MSKYYITGGRDSHWFPTKAKTLASAKSIASKTYQAAVGGKIEVAEHEIMVKNIRKECAERQAQQEQQQAERFREMMAQAQAITTININPNQEIPTRDTDNSHGITPDSDGLLF